MTPADATARGDAPVLAGAYDVHKWFAGVHALKGATIEIRAGEVHCLVGENGAGKSTLVKILAGVYAADDGRVQLGEAGAPRSPDEALQQGISTVFQELTLVPEMTVAENVWLGREPKHGRLVLNRAERRRRTARMLEDFGIQGIHPDDKVRDLGIARQQLVEIAKAASRDDERVVIMDEPTATLTGPEVETLFRLVRRLRERRLGILYITHRLEELWEIGDVVTVMRDGEIVASGSAAATDRQSVIEQMVGRKIEDLYPRGARAAEPGDVVLELGPTADGPTIQVRRGQVTGVFGLVGAGRTELVRELIGVDPNAGLRVRMNGVERRFRTPSRALASGIALVPEDRKGQGIVPEMSVASNIALSSIDRSATGFVTSAQRLARVAEGYLRDLNIKASSPQQRIRDLSGGNQQKCLIARALAVDADVVILDEPTRGVDVGARIEVYRLIERLCEQDRGVLMITSDLPEVLGMSDVVYVMRAGQVAGRFEAGEAAQGDVMRLALASDTRRAA